jgi:hypothetical protein
MKKVYLASAIGSLFAACLTPTVQGGVIAVSSGIGDPTTAALPWYIAQENATSAGPNADNTAWQVSNGSPGRLNYNLYDNSLNNFHSQPLALGHFNDPSGWTMTVTAKVNNVTNVFDHAMEVMDGTSRWFWSITSSGAGWINNTATFVPVASVDTSVFNTYQLVQQPGAVGEVEMYLNGELVHTQTAAQVLTSAPFAPGTGRAYYGDNIRVSPIADFEFSLLRFETGVNVVPEPSTIVVAALAPGAVLALAGRGVRRRHN